MSMADTGFQAFSGTPELIALGDVAAVKTHDFGKEAELGETFVEWLFENEDAIRAAKSHEIDNPIGQERFARLYDKVPSDKISREDFLEITRFLPFDQIMADLEDFNGTRASDQDEDLRDYVKTKLKIQPGDRLLDAGCSTGRNFLDVPNDVSCVGVDLSLVSLLVGAHIWKNRPNSLTPEFCAGDVLDMPLDDASFDKVQVYGVLGIVPIREALTELARVTKPGGTMALFVEGTGFWQEQRDITPLVSKRSVELARWYLGRKLQENGIYWKNHPLFGRIAGLVQYTPETLAGYLEECGFVVEDISIIRTYKGQPRVMGACARRVE